MIINEIKQQEKKWTPFRDQVVKIYEAASPKYASYENLVTYLEKLMLKNEVRLQQPVKRWLSKDFSSLKILHRDGLKLFKEKVMIML